MDPFTAIATVSQASSPFLLAAAVWAFASGKVVPRWVHDAAEKRADDWRTLALRQQTTVDRSLTAAEKVVAP